MSIFEHLQGYFLTGMLFALPATLLISWGLLAFYRRAVIRNMRSQTSSSHLPAEVDLASKAAAHPPTSELSINILSTSLALQGSSDGGRLFKDALRGPWRAVLVYGLAGLCYAFLFSVVKLKADRIELLPFRLTVITLIYYWPIFPVLWIVVGKTFRIRILLVGIYALLLLVLGFIEYSFSPSFDWMTPFLIWNWCNAWPTIALLFVLNRKTRTVGPLVLVFLFFGITGALVLFSFIANQQDVLSYVIALGNVIGLSYSQKVAAIFLVGFLAVGAVGWLIAKWIQKRYEARKISDQSILVDTIWFLFVIFHVIYIGISRVEWIPFGILVYLVYRILVWAGMTILVRTSVRTETPVDLLLLRVFSLGKRSEQLYDALSMHWRYVGNLRMISGPDLATSTVDPHEFIYFLTRKLKQLFTHTVEALEHGLTALDNRCDPDGRFRAVEFFCHADVWKEALARLAKISDVIVMDLRSFGAQHKGCIFEINALMDLIPLERILLLVDDTTDTTFLHQTLQSAWAHLDQDSPNREGEKVAQLYRFEGPKDLTGLLQTLSVSAVS